MENNGTRLGTRSKVNFVFTLLYFIIVINCCCDPIRVNSNVSVDPRKVWASTAITPADQSYQSARSSTHRATRVSLASIFFSYTKLTSAEHSIENCTIIMLKD